MSWGVAVPAGSAAEWDPGAQPWEVGEPALSPIQVPSREDKCSFPWEGLGG